MKPWVLWLLIGALAYLFEVLAYGLKKSRHPLTHSIACIVVVALGPVSMIASAYYALRSPRRVAGRPRTR